MFLFEVVLDSQQKWAENTEMSPKLYPHTHTAAPTLNILHQTGTFVVMDEPALTHNWKIQNP